VTIPSEVSAGVVARSVAALSKGPTRVLGYVENMSGYYCRDCNAIKPLFVSTGRIGLEIPCLGTVPSIPSSRGTATGDPVRRTARHAVARRLEHVAQQTSRQPRIEPRSLLAMKFLCVPCDSPMKLQTVGRPSAARSSVVYSCPECGYEMAMLTNAYETQVVQSLGVRIGPRRGRGRPRSGRRQVSVHRDDPGDGRARRSRRPRRPLDRAAEARLANIPEFVRPMAKTGHRAIRPGARDPRSRREDARRGQRLLRHVNMPVPTASGFARPYVVSWNLTYRCNLACEHCYLDAGGAPQVGTENFADRSELGTEECFRVIEDISAFAPECVTILTGGEPLLRRDILEIVRRASERGLWVVVRHQRRQHHREPWPGASRKPARAGLSLSLDALDPDRHDHFRKVRGAWRNTVQGAEILNRTGLPFIVQTTVGSHNLGELEAIADFAHDRLAAKVWNLYFLVPTGRGAVRVGHHPRAVRRGARLTLPDPAEVTTAGCS
jgi:molybdenum cofactor biosynthesis enzyme MoaA